MCYTIITKGMTEMAKYVVEIFDKQKNDIISGSTPLPKEEAMEVAAMMLKPAMFGTDRFRVCLRRATKEEKECGHRLS